MKKSTKIIWGVIFIIAGILIALEVTDIVDVSEYLFFDGWWTLFIIVPFTVSFFTEGIRVGNIVGLLVGVALLLASLDVISFDLIFKLFVPIIVIAAGISLIFGDKLKGIEKNADKRIKEIKSRSHNTPSYAAVFSGQELRFAGEKLEGLKLDAVFGGIDCDLRGAIIENDIVIDATAVFGGIDIIVPLGHPVKVRPISIFGGVSNEIKYDICPEKPTIYINGSGVFGGVDIR